MNINYKMVSVGLVMVAILVVLLTTAVFAAPSNPNVIGDGKGVAYDAQCSGDCGQGTGDCSGQCTGNGKDGRRGLANKGNSQGCSGTCRSK